MAFSIAALGVNVPFSDQWDLIPQLVSVRSSTLALGDLWRPENGHRVVVARLLTLGVLAETGDLRVLMWISFVLAVLAFIGVLLLIRPRAAGPAGRLVVVAATSLLMFSAVQIENWLNGQQGEWYVGLVAAIGAFLALARRPARPVALLVALACALAASFSSAQGLAVWPAGMLAIALTWPPGRPRLVAGAAWAAVAAAVLLPHVADAGGSDAAGDLLERAPAALLYFLAYLGNPTRLPKGVAAALGWDPDLAPVLFSAAVGMVGLIAGLVVAREARRQGLDRQDVAASATLAIYALAADGLTALSRLDMGVAQALSNRYAMFSSLYWVALLVPAAAALAARPDWLPRRPAIRRSLQALALLLAIGY